MPTSRLRAGIWRMCALFAVLLIASCGHSAREDVDPAVVDTVEIGRAHV